MKLNERITAERIKLGKLTYRLYREGVLTAEQVREFEDIEDEFRKELEIKVIQLEAVIEIVKELLNIRAYTGFVDDETADKLEQAIEVAEE